MSWCLSLAERDFQSQVTFTMLTSTFKASIQIVALSTHDGSMPIKYDGHLHDL